MFVLQWKEAAKRARAMETDAVKEAGEHADTVISQIKRDMPVYSSLLIQEEKVK